MCCLFCLSCRGAAYFGTTCQIILGIGIAVKYASSLPDVKLADLQEVGNGTVAVLFTYGLFIFAFGCCVFRGIEHESLRTLKVSVGGLTFLQCLVLVTHLVLISLTYDELKEEARMTQVKVLAANLVMTFFQLTILFLYMIQLAKKELSLVRRSRNSNSNASENSLPLSTATTKAFVKGKYSTASTGSTDSSGAEFFTGNSRNDSGGRGGGGYKIGSAGRNDGRYSVSSVCSTGQRYIDGHWEDLHV